VLEVLDRLSANPIPFRIYCLKKLKGLWTSLEFTENLVLIHVIWI